jgi:hypothetical protein
MKRKLKPIKHKELATIFLRNVTRVFRAGEREHGCTGVVTQDLNLRPRPPLQVLGLSKNPGQVGSQVRVSRKTQVRYRSKVRGSLRPGPETWT